MDGELAPRADLELGPYHTYREAFFREFDGDDLITLSLSVGSVELTLDASVLTAAFFFVTALQDDPVGVLEDVIEWGLEGLDDFGAAGRLMADAVSPFVPTVAALQTLDYFKPFTGVHTPYEYRSLFIEGDGRGIHLLNEASEPREDPPEGPGPGFPDDDDTIPRDPPILDHGDPLPGSGGGSPRANSTPVPRAEEIPALLTQLEAAGVSPLQEATSRLWLDGVPPEEIRWIPRRGHRPAGSADRRSAGLAGDAGQRRAPGQGRRRWRGLPVRRQPGLALGRGTLGTATQPFSERPDLRGGPGRRRDGGPLPVRAESTLARSRGTSVDPFWVGLSANVVAVQRSLEVLVASDTLAHEGTSPTVPTRSRSGSTSRRPRPRRAPTSVATRTRGRWCGSPT